MTPTVTFDMGSAIRERREAAGLTLLDLMVEVRNRLPRTRRVAVSHETLRRYENGKVPEGKADIVVLAALADTFGCKLSELSPAAAADLETLSDLLKRQKPCLAA